MSSPHPTLRIAAPAARDGAARRRVVLLCYALALLPAALPVLATDVPPLVDYPNHLARMHVLASGGADPALGNYVVDWRPVPNLGMDLIVPPLARVLPVTDAARLFLLLCFGMLVGGIAALHRVAHGRIGLTPAASVLMLYNLPFGWGFLNFYMGVGASLLVLAGWIATRRWRAAPRLLAFNAATGLLYLTHLFGFAAYCLAVAVFELRAAVEARELRPGALARRGGIALAQVGVPALLAGLRLYGGPADALALGFVALAAGGGWVAGWLRVAPMLRWHVPVFGLLVLVTPHVARGMFLDARIGLLAACFALAAVRFEIPRPAVARMLFAALVLVSAARLVAVHRAWEPYDRDYAEFRAALAAVTPGARVLSAHDVPGAPAELSYAARWQMAMPGLPPAVGYRGLINLAVVERGAFVPSMFTHPAAQPVRAAPRNRPIDSVVPARRLTTALLVAGADPARGRALAATAARHGEAAYWVGWPGTFDFVVVFRYDPGERRNPLPAVLEGVFAGSFFDIYRVRGPGPAGVRR